jgi:hypothetical protein
MIGPAPLGARTIEITGTAEQWFADRDRARSIALQLAGDAFFDNIEQTARTYDDAFGGSDAFAGCAMTCFIAGFPGERDLAIRLLAAVDLLRRATRSQ